MSDRYTVIARKADYDKLIAGDLLFIDDEFNPSTDFNQLVRISENNLLDEKGLLDYISKFCALENLNEEETKWKQIIASDQCKNWGIKDFIKADQSRSIDLVYMLGKFHKNYLEAGSLLGTDEKTYGTKANDKLLLHDISLQDIYVIQVIVEGS